ncbi:hypothetical protein B0T20DRAFT_503904 [Sordaria brevicollis]|uniref:Uncharacterized protein n=1 Tax=Sordaria brevicollis TaxID=83679 RepID=A0AAE0PKN1_SORBR|nr:hypothetical protein B0T20DRAFT_503904 [Sordaria brevicollis]
MSGIEVAGLVLGVLPVVIQALNGYRSILSSIRNVESDIQALILGLETERVRLRTSCELLLEGIVPAKEIDDLLEDPFSEKWKALGVTNKLKIRLWDAVTTYERTIGDMKTVEAELKRSVGFMVQEDGKLKFNEKTSLLREWKSKSGFTLRKKDYDHIISRLQSANTFLDSCANRGRQLETSRKQRSYDRVIRILRNLTTSLFKALQNAASTCYCPKPHDVDACLELMARDMVFIHTVDKEDQVEKTVDFHVALSCANSDRTLAERSSLQSQQRWTNFRLQCTGHGPRALPSTVRPSISSQSSTTSLLPSETTTSTLQSSKEIITGSSTRVRGWSRTATELSSLLHVTKPLKSRKRVGWADASTTTVGALIHRMSTTSTLVTVPQLSSPTCTSQPPTDIPDESPLDLCRITLNKGKAQWSGENCYGCIIDQTKDRRFGLYPPQGRNRVGATLSQPEGQQNSGFLTSLTLRQILEGQQRGTSTHPQIPGACRVPKLTLEAKLNMAHSISASVVHIHSTPWSSQHKVLTLDDILILVDDSNDQFDVDRPFISRPIQISDESLSLPRNHSLTYTAAPDNNQQPHHTPISTETHSIFDDERPFDPLPFSLGLLLLQLILGKVVDEIDLRGLYPLTIKKAQQISESAAHIASVQLNAFGGDILLNAVRWCLERGHGDIRAGFGDEEFCQEFCVSVVEKLEVTARGVAKARRGAEKEAERGVVR